MPAISLAAYVVRATDVRHERGWRTHVPAGARGRGGVRTRPKALHHRLLLPPAAELRLCVLDGRRHVKIVLPRLGIVDAPARRRPIAVAASRMPSRLPALVVAVPPSLPCPALVLLILVRELREGQQPGRRRRRHSHCRRQRSVKRLRRQSHKSGRVEHSGVVQFGKRPSPAASWPFPLVAS